MTDDLAQMLAEALDGSSIVYRVRRTALIALIERCDRAETALADADDHLAACSGLTPGDYIMLEDARRVIRAALPDEESKP